MGRRQRVGDMDRAKEELLLDLTPMIDVTFLILIFFMVSLKFKTLAGKLEAYLPTERGFTGSPIEVPMEDAEVDLVVPEANGNRDRSPEAREVVILRRGNNTPLGKCTGMSLRGAAGPVYELRFEPADTLDRVRGYLEGIRQGSEESMARLHVDPRVPELYAVLVMDLMKGAGFERISYSGSPAQLAQRLQSGEVR